MNILQRAARFTYGDARGKVTAAIDSGIKKETLLASYSGLGFLVASRYSDAGIDYQGLPRSFSSADTMTYDALGNVLTSKTAFSNATSAFEDARTSTGRNYEYDAVTGRLIRMFGDPRSDTLVYDSAGNVRFQSTRPQTLSIREDRMSYVAGDGTLRAVDRRTRLTVGGPFTFTFEEYWYDALGRRVLTRTRRDCADPETYDLETCSISTVRRTIWDGAKELFEIQMPDTTATALAENDTALLPNLGVTLSDTKFSCNPFFGRVGYTNGPGIDQPLTVTRWGYSDTLFVGSAAQQRFEQWKEPFTIVPHWNMRGQPANGTDSDGALVFGCGGGTPPGGGSSSGRCAVVLFPYGWTAYWQKMYRQPSWHGSLLDEKRDGSQLIFKRSRYYDPATGRFTQEDPIGLAGGLNLYGFAEGDPVNFADPVGLFACPPDCGFEGDPRNLEREVRMVQSRTPRDVAVMAGVVGAGAVVGVGGFALLARLAGPTIPVLVSGRGHDMLRQAVRELQGMASSQRVGAFRDFARQIEAATQGSWAAAEQQAVNATVFAGRAGEAIVFNAQGQAFRGNIGNAEQFTRTASGLVANFDKLNQIVR